MEKIPTGRGGWIVMRTYAVRTLIGALVLAISSRATSAMADGTRSEQHGGVAPGSPCSLANVRISVSWSAVNKNLPGGGAAVGSVSLRLAHGASCTLAGWPRLRLQDAHGAALPVGQQNVDRTSGVQSPVELTLPVAGHYTYGRAQVTWLNWCKGNTPLPLKMAVRLPKGTASTIVPITPGGRVIASCVNPTASSALQVNPLQQATST